MLREDVTFPTAGRVAAEGWSHGRLPIPASGLWDEFAKAWEDLPVDAYVTSQHRTTRHRRIGRLLVRAGGTSADVIEPATFFQSAEVNSVYGGTARVFAPVDPEFFGRSAVRELLAHDIDLIRAVGGPTGDWLVTVHLVRVIAAGGETSAPAPEGRHQDGHEFVIMHLIGRQNCAGGDSRVYRGTSPNPVMSHTMTEPLETLVLDDRRMQHEVTPIGATGDGAAIRDLMIIDFDRTTDGAGLTRLGSIDLAPNR